jgi:hypothetical protein
MHKDGQRKPPRVIREEEMAILAHGDDLTGL